MNTIYQRVLEFEKLHSTFQFNQKGIQLVGYLVRNEWLRQGGRIDQLDCNWQQERYGNYMVFEYPTSFMPTIDKVIQKYVQRVIAKGINKRKTASPPNRKRKRIPVTRPVKPAFSGRKLKK